MSKRGAQERPELSHPSIKRAKEIDANVPLAVLEKALKSHTSSADTKTVLFWFRTDLRLEDNKGLLKAYEKCKFEGTPLICCYLWSPGDLEWHGDSPARIDFMLQNLEILHKQLLELDIPLVILTAGHRSEVVSTVADFIKENGVSHLFANLEYEYDELSRDTKLLNAIPNVVVEMVHDTTAVVPGSVHGGTGPMKVFTPYHKQWLQLLAKEPSLLSLFDRPGKSPKKAPDSLFKLELPSIPEGKSFKNDNEKKLIHKLWPAGYEAAEKRLQSFLSKKVTVYADTRSNPAKDSSSRLSPYFSNGVLSVRKALSEARKKGFDDPGVASWVREIAFREFYRQRIVIVPHNAMNLPHNLRFDNVKWNENDEVWHKWKQGKTGYPFVDAGMRQLNTEAWMHNRLRMNTASFLRTNLLLDYRRGETYFANHLIDWDLANNTQGWEPSYTVFNPIVQAEKNDAHGDYIRRWVPELKDVLGKAIFMPYDRLSKPEFDKLGYPEPCVDFQKTKAEAVARFKQDLHEFDT